MTCKYDKYDPIRRKWICTNPNERLHSYGDKCTPSTLNLCYASCDTPAIDGSTLTADDLNIHSLVDAAKDIVRVYLDGEITLQCITDLISAIKTWEEDRNGL